MSPLVQRLTQRVPAPRPALAGAGSPAFVQALLRRHARLLRRVPPQALPLLRRLPPAGAAAPAPLHGQGVAERWQLVVQRLVERTQRLVMAVAPPPARETGSQAAAAAAAPRSGWPGPTAAPHGQLLATLWQRRVRIETTPAVPRVAAAASPVQPIRSTLELPPLRLRALMPEADRPRPPQAASPPALAAAAAPAQRADPASGTPLPDIEQLSNRLSLQVLAQIDHRLLAARERRGGS